MIDDAVMHDGFLSTREVADLLRISPSGVRKMVKRGRLHAYRRGPHGGLVISRRSVAQMLENPAWARARRRAEDVA
jgi:excisionase family DNA binding protein